MNERRFAVPRTAWLIVSIALCPAALGAAIQQFPAPPPAEASSNKSTEETAVLAGGCFWGVEAVFERLKGVKDVVSGFSGGNKASANYNVVSTGTSGHAEAVRIVYDPREISYGTLLEVFFSIAHDPTQLNRQGPDEGPQYRSSIFYEGDEQKRIAEAYIRKLNDAHVFSKPIATTVVKLDGFYPAGSEHQNFVRRNPNNPYVSFNDLPKLDHLQKAYPQLLKK
jgi:peptide-methionine (S)-S-oxide reductase